MTPGKAVVLTLSISLVVPFRSFAQEHPEHPKSKPAEKQEHPKEHPSKAAVSGYSMDELERAIRTQIEATQKKRGGWYRLKDKQTKKTWVMKLDHVHRERLSKLDPRTYFACTDFKTADGHTVDVDFFMKDDGKRLVMRDATVHKIDGKARYDWEEKDGFWSRVPVKRAS